MWAVSPLSEGPFRGGPQAEPYGSESQFPNPMGRDLFFPSEWGKLFSEFSHLTVPVPLSPIVNLSSEDTPCSGGLTVPQPYVPETSRHPLHSHHTATSAMASAARTPHHAAFSSFAARPGPKLANTSSSARL